METGVKAKSHKNVVSLFSGCGGFDIGFKQAGFTTLGAFDSDDIAVDHFNKNIAKRAHVIDLSQEVPALPRGTPIDVVLAGPPCQGFSTAGRRDPNDSRNDLLPIAGELGARLKPKVLVIENVAAALSGQHAKHWNTLNDQLREAGYRTHSLFCNAIDLGIAQSRRRLFMFAWRTKKEVDIAWPKVTRARLDHVLAGVELLPNHNPKPLPPDSRLYKISERIGPGQKLSNVRGGIRSVHTWHIPEVFGATTAAECELLEILMKLRRSERRRDHGDADPVSLVRLKNEVGSNTRKLVESLIKKGYLRRIGEFLDLAHTFNGKHRRFRWDDIASTVDTRFGDPHLFLHPNEHRPFTVREAARIQGFPDNYKFFGNEKDHFRLIGNAVPPVMAYAAANIVDGLLGK